MADLICAKCNQPIPEENAVECPFCWEVYHKECWEDTENCVTCKKYNPIYEMVQAQKEYEAQNQQNEENELKDANNTVDEEDFAETVTREIPSSPVANSVLLASLILLISGVAGGIALAIYMYLTSRLLVGVIGGLALAGLGLIFIGLDAMSSAMKEVAKPVDDPSTIEIEMNFIQKALGSIKNPFLLLLLGMIATAVVQSSSAMTAIIISMVGSGLVIGNGGNSVLFVILGTNIGTCITALLSSIGATTNGKRASLIHFMFNFFGSVVFTIVLLLWSGFMEDVLMKLIPDAKMQVAVFHILFNVLCTVMFLPLTKIFVKISQFIINDKKQE